LQADGYSVKNSDSGRVDETNSQKCHPIQPIAAQSRQIQPKMMSLGDANKTKIHLESKIVPRKARNKEEPQTFAGHFPEKCIFGRGNIRQSGKSAAT
jgi:hypothetical protein